MDFRPFLMREDFTACLSLSWIWMVSASSSVMVSSLLLGVIGIDSASGAGRGAPLTTARAWRAGRSP